MKTTIERIPEMTIEEYAELHDLEMVVKERDYPEGDPARFYASFRGADIRGDGVLIGAFGNGATPEDAIKEYAQRLHLKTLVIGYPAPNKKEIRPVRIKL